MPELARTEGKVFRMAAPRLFLFLVGVGVPLFFGMVFLKNNGRFNGQLFLLGLAFLVPVSVIISALVSLAFPVRLTREGIHAQNAWGLPSFVRWGDIESARPFTFINLRWLRISSSADREVTWLALFQSPDAEFRVEVERLAPPDCPLLEYVK